MATRGNITVTCPIPRPEEWCDSSAAARGALVCYKGSSGATTGPTCRDVGHSRPPVGDTRPMDLTSTVRRLGRTRWFARAGRATAGLDRRLQKVSRGRWSTLGRPTLPQLILTTTGRRSGEPREAVLLYAVDGDGWVLIGSNWGQEHHPAWSGNLLADPRATVTIAGVTTPVVATLADDAERARLLPALLAVWPGYEDYAARAGRDLRVFRLSPQD